MPIIEYQYVTESGETKKVEEIFRMSDLPPDAIMVEEEGKHYVAVRVLSLPAGKHSSWEAYDPSDLPPVDSPRL